MSLTERIVQLSLKQSWRRFPERNQYRRNLLIFDLGSRFGDCVTFLTAESLGKFDRRNQTDCLKDRRTRAAESAAMTDRRTSSLIPRGRRSTVSNQSWESMKESDRQTDTRSAEHAQTVLFVGSLRSFASRSRQINKAAIAIQEEP